MTTSPAALITTSDKPIHVLPYAAGGAALAALASAVGTFANLTGNGSNDYGLTEYVGDLALIAVATAVVFGLVVRTAQHGSSTRRALTLGALSLPAVLVFWSGLPYILAVGALACARVASRSGSSSRSVGVAVTLSAVSIAVSLFFAVTG